MARDEIISAESTARAKWSDPNEYPGKPKYPKKPKNKSSHREREQGIRRGDYWPSREEWRRLRSEAVAGTFTDKWWTLTQAVVWVGTRNRDAVAAASHNRSPWVVSGIAELHPRRNARSSRPDVASYVGLAWIEANFSAGEWTEWIAMLEKELANFHMEGIPAGAAHSRAITPSELLNLVLSRSGGFSFPPRLISRREQHGEAKAIFTNVLIDRVDLMRVFPSLATEGETKREAELSADVWPDWPKSEPDWGKRALRKAWRAGFKKHGPLGPPASLTDKELATDLNCKITTARRLTGRA